MKKFLLIDIIVAFLFLTISFIIASYTNYKVSDSTLSTPVIMIQFFISIFIVFILSVFASARYAKANNKKISDYIKRMWSQVISLCFLGVGATYGVGIISEIVLGGLAVKANHPFFSGFIVKFPIFIIYIFIVCKFLINHGHKSASIKTFNLSLQVLTMIYASIFTVPFAVRDGIYSIPNPHTIFTVNIPLSLQSEMYFSLNDTHTFNLALVLIPIILTLIAEIIIFMFSYIKGKQKFVKKRLGDYNHEADENNVFFTK